MNQQEQIKLNISLDKTQEVTCDKCGHQVFQEGLMLRKASKFLTGTAVDSLIPIPVFCCSVCHHVNETFLPEPLQNKGE